jgi:hypothetical protein
MSLDPLEKLWSEWLQEKLGQERAIGQILQHLLILQSEIKQLRYALNRRSDSDKKP